MKNEELKIVPPVILHSEFLLRNSNFSTEARDTPPRSLATLGMTCLALVLLSGCRTIRHVPEGTPLTPLTSSNARDAAQQLAARRSQFRGERSLIRLRLPNGVSARAQLQVDPSLRMMLTVYTPIGTTAARLYSAAGDVVFINDLEKTAWRGRATELGGALDTFATEAAALLIIGLPPGGDAALSYSPAGLARASLADVIIRFDPPSYPPQHVTIVRGEQQIEIDHLESVEGSETLRAPEVPGNYRCCVAPQL